VKIAFGILAAVLLNSGCGGGPPTIVSMYSWEGIAREKNVQRIPLRVIVAKLDDLRPEEEKIGEGKGKGFVATRDKFFKDFHGELNEAVVKHIREVGLFLDVQPASYVSSEVNEARLRELGQKADAVLVGNISHFYGIVYRDLAGQERMMNAGIMGGPFGVMIMAGIESSVTKEVEGHVALTEVKLLDLKSGEALWQGSVESQFRREQKGLPGSSELAVEALKGAITKLVSQLRDTKTKAD
jgi:hypothetical protein